ncbi:MAG TPA: PIN domain-containing protein [Stellaceae bacterium]|nr:PIN domain-containing protein [Stellaceae bacterium]
MIYLDTSVALAQLLAEDQRPSNTFWREALVSSRLLEYEVSVRINSRGLAPSHREAARALLGNIGFVELTPVILSRALDPFPIPVRTLDALHLAALEFLRGQGQTIELASYDRRMIAAAQALKIPIARL